jgi:predicted nucleic acid-binding protein
MKLIHKTVDAITGEETFIEIEETAAEIKIRKAFEAEAAKEKAEAEAKAIAKTAIADRLGLTADELQVLLG